MRDAEPPHGLPPPSPPHLWWGVCGIYPSPPPPPSLVERGGMKGGGGRGRGAPLCSCKNKTKKPKTRLHASSKRQHAVLDPWGQGRVKIKLPSYCSPAPPFSPSPTSLIDEVDEDRGLLSLRSKDCRVASSSVEDRWDMQSPPLPSLSNPPPFQTITRVVVVKRGGRERGGSATLFMPPPVLLLLSSKVKEGRGASKRSGGGECKGGGEGRGGGREQDKTQKKSRPGHMQPPPIRTFGE
nr:hypothetical protein [Morchella crassipes]